VKARDRFLLPAIACRLDGMELPVANVSVGGLFLATELAVFTGQVLELELALGGLDPFRVQARVTWLNEPDDPRAPDLPRGFGVQITRIGLREKLALLEAIKRSPAAPMRDEAGRGGG
jgi:hypothetical protein